MINPAIKAEGVVFRESFLNATRVGMNGGEIYGAPSINRGYDGAGSPDFIEYGEVNIGTEHTISAVVSYNGLNSIPIGGTVNTMYAFGYLSNKIYYNTELSYVSFAFDPTIGQKYKMDIVRSGTSVTLYVDGVAISTETLNGGNNDFKFKYIGKQTGGLYHDGTIENVKISSRILSAKETLDSFNKSTFTTIPCVSLLLKDQIGTADTYTTTCSVTGRSANLGTGSAKPSKLVDVNGYDFTSAAEQIVMPACSNHIMGNNGAVEVLFEATSFAAGSHCLAALGASGDYADGFFLNAYGDRLFMYWKSAGPTYSSTNILKAGLNHVVMTNTDGAMTLYLNGEAIGTGTSGGAITAEKDLYFGYNGFGAVVGQHKKYRLFKEGLTETQVKDLYFNL